MYECGHIYQGCFMVILQHIPIQEGYASTLLYQDIGIHISSTDTKIRTRSLYQHYLWYWTLCVILLFLKMCKCLLLVGFGFGLVLFFHPLSPSKQTAYQDFSLIWKLFLSFPVLKLFLLLFFLSKDNCFRKIQDKTQT